MNQPTLRERLAAAKPWTPKPKSLPASKVVETLNDASLVLGDTPEEILRRECKRAKIDLDRPERRSAGDAETVCGYRFSGEELYDLDYRISHETEIEAERRDPVSRDAARKLEADLREEREMGVAW